MNELLLNDETLTTADIAHPETVREVRAATIEDGSLLPARVKPSPKKQRRSRPVHCFPTMNYITFARVGIRFRPHSGFRTSLERSP